MDTNNLVWECSSFEEGKSYSEGEKGDQGQEGLRGPKGDRGAQGIQGIQGERGQQGEIGPAGPRGFAGERGLQGIKGDKGDIGQKGDKGETGQRGEKGLQGIRGEVGPQGIKGEKGDIGPIGARGPKGEKGDKGDKGDKGLTGVTGPQGQKGNDGVTPHIGTNGNWFIGSHDTGLPSRGIPGPKGNTGVTGSQGPKGDTGPRGPGGISDTANKLNFIDNRDVKERPKELIGRNLTASFKNRKSVDYPPVYAGESYVYILNVLGWSSYEGSGGWPIQLAIGTEGIALRQAINADTWGNWAKTGTEIIVSDTQPSGHVKGRVWIDIS